MPTLGVVGTLCQSQPLTQVKVAEHANFKNELNAAEFWNPLRGPPGI
jgi:hypothetical protein